MKNGKTLVELAQEIERQNNSKEDMIANTSALSFKVEEGENILTMQNGSTVARPINSTAMRQITDRMGIPSKYAEKMMASAPELLGTNINHWFQNEPKKQMIRIMDGRIRGVMSDRYARIDNFDVAQVALPILQGSLNGLKIVSAEITEKRLYIKAVTPRLQGEIGKGDVVQAGVVITNSEIGFGALTVSPLIYRLVCLNGMISQDGKFRRNHIGARADLKDQDYRILSQETIKADDTAILLKTRDYIQHAISEASFETQINKLKEASEQKITGSPDKAVEVLAKSAGLTSDEQGGVLRHLIEGGDISKWGVVNAVTRFSQDVDGYDRATEFEALGGKIVEMNKTEWNAIATAA